MLILGRKPRTPPTPARIPSDTREMIQPETRHRPRSSRIYAESMARPRSKYPLKKPPAENVRKNTRARIPKNMGIPHTGWARSRSARSVKESNTLPTLGSVFLLFCAGLPLYRIQAAANRRAGHGAPWQTPGHARSPRIQKGHRHMQAHRCAQNGFCIQNNGLPIQSGRCRLPSGGLWPLPRRHPSAPPAQSSFWLIPGSPGSLPGVWTAFLYRCPSPVPGPDPSY